MENTRCRVTGLFSQYNCHLLAYRGKRHKHFHLSCDKEVKAAVSLKLSRLKSSAGTRHGLEIEADKINAVADTDNHLIKLDLFNNTNYNTYFQV